MSASGNKTVQFSMGFGIFETDDEVNDGWNQSPIPETCDDQEMDYQQPEESDNIQEAECGACQGEAQYRLTAEEALCVELRENVSYQNLCSVHYKFLVEGYSGRQKSCCNPYKVHSKAVKARLSIVTLDMYRRDPRFLPGKKICRSCHARFNQENGEDIESHDEEQGDVGEEHWEVGDGGGDEHRAGDGATGGDGLGASQGSSWSTHTWSQEFHEETRLQTVNQALGLLDMSPVKKSELGNPTSMSAKLSKINDGIKRHLNIEQTKCPEQETAELLSSLKNQYQSALTRRDKYKILTSLPENWNWYKMVKELGCSRTLAVDALKLRASHGPGSDPGAKAGHKIPNHVAAKVVQFFYDDDVSRQMPGKKDCVTIKEEGRRIVKQKRLLLANLREAYVHFKGENPDLAIGLTTFCTLRPREVILAGE